MDFKIPGTELPTIPCYTPYRCCHWNSSELNSKIPFGLDGLVSFGRCDYKGLIYIKAETEGYIGDRFYMFKESDLIKLAEEQGMINQNNQEMNYQSFAITGSVPLLKAMEETLVGMGMKSSECFSFIDKSNSGLGLCSNHTFPTNRGQFIELCGADVGNSDKNMVQFSLPTDWDKVIEFVDKQLKQEEFKVGTYVVITNTGSEVTMYIEGKVRIGAKTGDIVKIEGSSSIGGNASETDLRYYGDNWNLRKESFRKATPEEIAQAQVKTFNMGAFNLTVKDNKVFHQSEDITLFTKKLVEHYKRETSFGNPSRVAVVKEVIFSKVGCENNETKLSDWIKVYNALTK